MGAVRAGRQRHNRNLWLVQISWACFVTADLALLVLLSVVAFSLGGVAGVGVVGATRVLPGAVLGPLLAPVADRVRREVLLSCLHAFWAVSCLGLAATAALGSFVGLVVVCALGSLGAALFRAGLRALMAQVVQTPAELVRSNGVYAAIEGVGTVVGPACAGALVALFSPPVALAGLAAVFLVGAVSSALVRTAFQPSRRTTRMSAGDVLAGWRSLTQPNLRLPFALVMSQCLMRGLLTVFVAAICLAPAGGGEARVAGLFSALGAGGLLGAVVASRSPGLRSTARRLALGVALWGLPVAVLGLAPYSWAAWLAMAAIGVGNAMEDVYGLSLVDRLVPDHVAARAWTTFWSVAAAMVTAGSLLGPILVSELGLGSSMVVTGGILLAFALVAVVALASLDAAVSVPPPHFELLQSAAELEPLPTISLERLARALRTRELSAGEVVMTEGDRADTFAIVASGTLQVRQRDQFVRELRRGDTFGEIGLLMGLPRTATVQAAEPATILTLDAETFVAAVTGHRHASASATLVATETLAADEERSRQVPGS
jgi:MFS family permease